MPPLGLPSPDSDHAKCKYHGWSREVKSNDAFVAADDHETDYEFGVGSDDDDQIGDGEPRLQLMNDFMKLILN